MHRTGDGDELTTAEIKRLLDEARALGVIEIIFSGGEPLLRPDMIELVRHASDLGLLTRLNTNGLLLNRETVSALKEAGVSLCAVSVDSADPAEHDRLRGMPGLHQQLTEGIRLLREFRVPCQILTYASKESIPDGLKRTIAYARSLRVLAIFIFFPMAVGRWEGAFDQVLNDTQRRQVRDLQDMTFVHLEIPSPATQCCSYAGRTFYVTASGDATPCPFVPFVGGSVHDMSIAQLWMSYREGVRLDFRGECPMNFPAARDELEERMRAVRARNTAPSDRSTGSGVESSTQ